MTVFGRCAPEQNTLFPFRTKSSPSATALVCRLAASEPEPGSVIETLNLVSPARKPGRYLWRCSAVPWLAMLVAVNIDVITAAAKSRLNLAIASQKIAYITGSASRPP